MLSRLEIPPKLHGKQPYPKHKYRLHFFAVNDQNVRCLRILKVMVFPFSYTHPLINTFSHLDGRQGQTRWGKLSAG